LTEWLPASMVCLLQIAQLLTIKREREVAEGITRRDALGAERCAAAYEKLSRAALFVCMPAYKLAFVSYIHLLLYNTTSGRRTKALFALCPVRCQHVFGAREPSNYAPLANCLNFLHAGGKTLRPVLATSEHGGKQRVERAARRPAGQRSAATAGGCGGPAAAPAQQIFQGCCWEAWDKRHVTH
jgi:hypothetical protein